MNPQSLRLELRLMFAPISVPWTEHQRSSQLRMFIKETRTQITMIKSEDGHQKELRLDRERRLYALLVYELRRRQANALHNQMQEHDYSSRC